MIESGTRPFRREQSSNVVEESSTIVRLGPESVNAAPRDAAFFRCETIRSQDLVARSNIHDDAQITQPFAFGIDIEDSQNSLFLKAPLARCEGGTQKCRSATYESTNDADYQHLLELVVRAVDRAIKFPRRDLKWKAQSDELN